MFQTLTECVVADHLRLRTLFDQFRKSAGEEQVRFANELSFEIVRHASAEELVVHPLLLKLPEGKGHFLVDQDRAQHQVYKDLLSRCLNLQHNSPEYLETMSNLMREFMEHNTSEENEDLPLVEKNFANPEESRLAAESFDRTKMFIPTVNAHSPFNTLPLFLSAPFEKVKEVFATF